ncbi:MAG TPA: helix-turn-helix domain-containing protein [Patescibacteria group bacterium]|nr:helix-turn-helix domain-containing protein [Patescibacteria group bacterium]
MAVNPFNPTFTAGLPRTWPPLLTIDQVSKILNLSAWTLRQWDKQGKLIALRFGSRQDRRYKKEEIILIFNNGMEMKTYEVGKVV